MFGIVQVEDLLLLGGQALRKRPNLIGFVATIEVASGFVVTHRVSLFQLDGIQLPFSVKIDQFAPCKGEDPRSERAALVETRKGPKGADKGPLGQVLGLMSIPELVREKLKDPIIKLGGQCAERVRAIGGLGITDRGGRRSCSGQSHR